MTKRVYKDEQYLRSEHLLRDGKYVSAEVEVSEIVYDFPMKKGDKDITGIALAFKGSDKVLGLNRTNESMLCFVTGQGKPENWVGKKIQLVVRMVRNKKVEEPAIRVWSPRPHPRGQVRDHMGKEITEDWYKANGLTQPGDATNGN